MIKDSPNPPGQPDYDTSPLHEVAYRAIAHYLNPAPLPQQRDAERHKMHSHAERGERSTSKPMNINRCELACLRLQSFSTAWVD